MHELSSHEYKVTEHEGACPKAQPGILIQTNTIINNSVNHGNGKQCG